MLKEPTDDIETVKRTRPISTLPETYADWQKTSHKILMTFDFGQAVLAKVIELNQAKKLTLKKNKPEEIDHTHLDDEEENTFGHMEGVLMNDKARRCQHHHVELDV